MVKNSHFPQFKRQNIPYPFKFWTLLAFSCVTFRFDRLK